MAGHRKLASPAEKYFSDLDDLNDNLSSGSDLQSSESDFRLSASDAEDESSDERQKASRKKRKTLPSPSTTSQARQHETDNLFIVGQEEEAEVDLHTDQHDESEFIQTDVNLNTNRQHNNNLPISQEEEAEVDLHANQQDELELEITPADEDLNTNRNEVPTKKLTRKQQRNPKVWASEVRKKAYHSGQAYTSRRGKNVEAKCLNTTKDCTNKCKFKCSTNITVEEREFIRQGFYNSNQKDKSHFYLKTTKRHEKSRVTVTRVNRSRRNYSFSYYFILQDKLIRVCKEYYLDTLSISQKPIYNAHKNKDPVTSSPGVDKRGTNSNSSRKKPAEVRQHVIDHIDSFPKLESHYCRATTKRQYLESHLNISKMYDLYVEKCAAENKVPVKLSYYRDIFKNEFNLGFHVPKNDRCDLCEEHRIADINHLVNEELKTKYDKHLVEKTKMREERNRERGEKTKTVLCFDLENVITLPKAGTSNFFYRRKLNTYNLTAHVSKTKKAYCAMWTEAMSGRAGNDMASALVKILQAVLVDLPEVTELTLWSDSCIPQNRNSVMSFALLKFIEDHPNITSIEMKFSVPGHSCIQEVDNLHSQIEKATQIAEYYSPVSLMTVLMKVNRKSPMHIMRMTSTDFKEYQAQAKNMQYTNVPYSKVSHLRFMQSKYEVEYKTSFSDNQFTKTNIRRSQTARQCRNEMSMASPTPMVALRPQIGQRLSKEKVNDLSAMLKWMPLVDVQYYTQVLKIPKPTAPKKRT